MAHPFLENLQILASEHLQGRPDIECKHFFSGAALYANGSICISLTPVGLAFKLPGDRSAELIETGVASPLRYFAKSPIKQGYALFSDFDSLDAESLETYFREATQSS
ncbi:MAG: TfoX/Sxy family protein [Gammaproteobacteria bacterium]|nr:TfoX/Sxy family protein [Gammaproteobacteria bacterium]MCZ6853554.1 TfoX/Sxy family protein [Gammaproteobacteria bacterium]